MSNNGHTDKIQLMIPLGTTRYRVLFRKAGTRSQWYGKKFFYKSVVRSNQRIKELQEKGPFEAKIQRVSRWEQP